MRRGALECAGASAALWRRRPSASAASLVNMAHLVFRWAAEAVSAKESDRLVAIAHPNAAVGAAVGIDVLRCCGPGESYRAGLTKGGTAHLFVVSGCCLPAFVRSYDRPVRLSSP